MQELREPVMPRAREDELVVEPLTDETLVYDLRRHKAHCLNRTATLVWQCCDGRTTVAEASGRLQAELRVPAPDALVWMGLQRLERARLLRDPLALPAARTRYSRRAVVRALGLGAAASAALPLIASIVAPEAAHAASCITSADCLAAAPPNCTELPICGSPGQCCRTTGQQCKVRTC